MGSSGRASISAAGNKNPQAVMYGLNEIIIITLKTYIKEFVKAGGKRGRVIRI